MAHDQPVAVIDLGSNSFHVLVVRARKPGFFETIAHHREELPLAEAVITDGRIGPELGHQAARVVGAMRGLAESFGVKDFRACATHAFRQAEDGAEVAALIREQSGIQVDVIDGEEEARLALRAANLSMSLPDSALVADLGGGSLDIASRNPDGTAWGASLALGTASLLAMTQGGSGGDVGDLVGQIARALRPVSAPHERPEALVGTGGTFEAVARSVLSRREEDPDTPLNAVELRLSELEELASESSELTASQRQRRYGISKRRAGTLPVGVAAAIALLRWSKLDRMILCDWGVREGLVIETLGIAEGPGSADAVREASVMAMVTRHHVDEDRALHVVRLAEQIFDGTVLLHQLGRPERSLLRYGALLAEAGRSVSGKDHERHTAYLIQHGSLRGFSHEELSVLSCLGRYHEGGTPKAEFGPFAELSDDARRDSVVLVAILQMAVALDKTRRSVVEGVQVRVAPGRIVLSLDVRGDPRLETASFNRRTKLAERALGRPVDFQIGSRDRGLQLVASL